MDTISDLRPDRTTRARHSALALLALLALVTPRGAAAIQTSRGASTSERIAPPPPAVRPSLLAWNPGPADTPLPPTATRLSTLCADDHGLEPLARALAERRAQAAADGAHLRAWLDSLDATLDAAPDGVTRRYRRAMVEGVRVETLEGRDRIASADRTRVLALAVLELDPEHPGAHFILGRLHAAVSRLGTMKRIMARAVAGGDLLSAASWTSARGHFERAEAGAPCIAEHHLELARLLAERDEPGAATREFRHVLELATGDGARAGVLRREGLRGLEALR